MSISIRSVLHANRILRHENDLQEPQIYPKYARQTNARSREPSLKLIIFLLPEHAQHETANQ